MQELIDQIVNRVPSLTDAQVGAMNAASLPSDAIIKANDVAGEETLSAMAQFGSEVDPGVYSVARTAILGILARGKVPDEVSATLVRVWTDIVEPLDEGSVEAPVAPSEPVLDTPEPSSVQTPETPVEPAADLVDVPLDLPGVAPEIAPDGAPGLHEDGISNEFVSAMSDLVTALSEAGIGDAVVHGLPDGSLSS